MKKLIIGTVLILLTTSTHIFAEMTDKQVTNTEQNSQIIEMKENDLIEVKTQTEVGETSVRNLSNNSVNMERRNQNQQERKQRFNQREERISERPRYQKHQHNEDCPYYIEGEHPRTHAHNPGQGYHTGHRRGPHHN